LKLPDSLAKSLSTAARKRGVSKSELIRTALEADINKGAGQSCLDLMGNFVGSFKGPADLSTNRNYLVQAIKKRATGIRNNS
jgi:hypothetical protein